MMRTFSALCSSAALIGIENKVWSGEQPRQLCDYQAALTKEFPRIHKKVFFLTPDQRQPLTAEEKSACSIQPVSYHTIVSMCDALIPRTTNDLQLLILSLRDYVRQNILQKLTMEKKIKQIVANLYRSAETRRVIELIIEHRPTVRAILENVAMFIERRFQCGAFGPNLECTHDYWPAEDHFAPELRLWLKPLNETEKRWDLLYAKVQTAQTLYLGSIYSAVECSV
jgi:hypothetical protein